MDFLFLKEPSEYQWGSYGVYKGSVKDARGLVDKGRILDYFSPNKNISIRSYMEYVATHEESYTKIIDMDDQEISGGEISNSVFTLSQAKKRMEEMISKKGLTYEELLSHIQLRDEYIMEMRKSSSLTLKQLGELFGGISESRVSRILSKR